MSQAASGYDRANLEKYYTPAWVTNALLEAYPFDNGVNLDPCAGGWDIVEALRAAGLLAEGFDIAPDPGSPYNAQGDFLELSEKEFAAGGYTNIVTNPPYGRGGRLGARIIAHALAITEQTGGRVAMLLPVDWDSGSTRRPLFAEHPAFAARFVLTRRIQWVNIPVKLDANGRPVGSTVNHMLAVWDWQHRGPPAASYLPIGRGQASLIASLRKAR